MSFSGFVWLAEADFTFIGKLDTVDTYRNVTGPSAPLARVLRFVWFMWPSSGSVENLPHGFQPEDIQHFSLRSSFCWLVSCLSDLIDYREKTIQKCLYIYCMYSVKETETNSQSVVSLLFFLEFIGICSMLLYNDDVHSPVTRESGSPIQLHVNANIRLLHGSD